MTDKILLDFIDEINTMFAVMLAYLEHCHQISDEQTDKFFNLEKNVLNFLNECTDYKNIKDRNRKLTFIS